MQLTRLGPYDIGAQLGKGGMGSVYAATDSTTGQRVAVKALTPHLAMADGFRERFEAEIESLKALRHDGIVRLYGYGEQDGVLYYSMELVEGSSLEDELKAGRRFNWREVTTIGIQLAQALKHAHDHGVVHRDIKPANVLLFNEDHVKLADFGIARLFGSTQLTTAGGVLGTADYMSPEQADGRPITPRCDQYSLGGVMYALLAGRPPFRAKNLPQMLQLQRFAEPEPVRRYAPDTPEQLERVILQLLAKEPTDRFPNMQVLARHFQAMLMALSRPAAEVPPSANDQADGLKDLPLEDSISTSQTHDDPGDGAIASRIPALSGGAMQQSEVRTNADTNGAGSAKSIRAADDAATLAAEEGTSESILPAKVGQVSPKTRLLAEPGTRWDVEKSEPAVPRPAHFTTVEEAEAQQRAKRRRDWPIIAAQLFAMMVVMAGVVALLMYLSRSATADELYDSVRRKTAVAGDSLAPIEGDLKEFFSRFPEDPRVGELRQVERQLALDRADRRLQFASRRGIVDASLLPVEQLYLKGLAAGQQAPEAGIHILDSLVALYGVPHEDNADDTMSTDMRARQDMCVALSMRQIVTWKRELAEVYKQELAALRERLTAAEQIAREDPRRAASMYRAIIELYQNQDWASDFVDEARRELEKISM